MRDKSMQEGMGKIDSRGKRERKREERVKGRRGEGEKGKRQRRKKEGKERKQTHMSCTCREAAISGRDIYNPGNPFTFY
jgi:hypothetical protein